MKIFKFLLFISLFIGCLAEAKAADTTKYPETVEELDDALDDVSSKSGNHTINLINMPDTINVGTNIQTYCDSSVDSITILGTFKTVTGDDTHFYFNCAKVVFEDIYFEDIIASYSILEFDGKGELNDCFFSNNQFPSTGDYGMIVFNGSATVDNSSFVSNNGTDAGLLLSNLIYSTSNVTVKNDSYFYNNTFDDNILNVAGNLAMSDSELAANETNFIAESRGDLTIDNSYIHNNTGNFRALFYASNSVNVDSGIFQNNSGNFFEADDLVISDSTFSNNSASSGLIYLVSSSVQITSSNFESNLATLSNGTILYITTAGVDVSISDSIFKSNLSEKDGAVFYFENAGDITIDGSLFESNQTVTSGNGGAIYNDSSDSLSISNTSFVNNTAVEDGGAIYSYASETYLVNSTFSGNEAGSDGGAFAGSLIKNMSHVTMAFNSAGDKGGALSATAESVNHSVLAYNEAGDEGFADCSGLIILEGNNVISSDCGVSSESSDQVGTDPLLVRNLETMTLSGVSQYYYNLYVESPAIDLLATCSVTLADGTTSYDDQIGNRRGTVQCDSGAIENQCDSSDADYVTYYADTDGDSYGDDSNTLSCCGCDEPTGYVTDNHDCDDTDASDTPVRYRDSDKDGYGDASNTAYANCATGFKLGYVNNDEDCDDTDDTINPEAVEVCDDIDNDCSGSIDDNATDATTWYRDFDRDSYGSTSTTKTACDKPSGYVAVSGDCKDSNKFINPGAAEVCDEVDNDCNGKIDDNPTDGTTWYRDSDGDDYGDLSTTKSSCTRPIGYVTDNTDCNDSDFNIYPGAPEQCDSLDNDCDGTTDEDVVMSTYYADSDGDTYGDASVTTTGCVAPSGYVSRAEDCDDSLSAVSPDATEICNTIDDDCDGSIDEEPSDGLTYYEDADGDGYGNEDTTVSVCDGGSVPETYIDVSGDCDDTLDSINPSATEICDEVDNNCDGAIDDVDADEDGISDCEAGTTTGSDTTGTDSSGGTTTGTDTTGSDSSGATTSGTDTTGTDGTSAAGSDTAGSDTTGSDTTGTDTTGTDGTSGAGSDTVGSDTTGSDTTGTDSSGTTTSGTDTTGTDGTSGTGSDTTGGDTTGSDTTGTSGGSGEEETPSETPETTGGDLNLSVEGGGCSLRF